MDHGLPGIRMSDCTFHNRSSAYGGMGLSDVGNIKVLGDENRCSSI